MGSPRAALPHANRMIVVLRVPSVAQRVATAKLATEAAERRWAAEAYAAQQQVLTQLARHGLATRPDYSYARVIDGFSAVLDPRALPLLEHNPEVAGVFPVRAAYPATIPLTAAGATAAVPGHRPAGPRRDRGHDRAARHRRRPQAPVSRRPGRAGHRRRRRDGDGGSPARSAEPDARRDARNRAGRCARRLGRARRDPGRRAGRLGHPDQGRRLAADAERRRLGLRALRPGDRGPRARRRSERRRRHPRRRADRPARCRGAVCLVPRQPRGAGRRRGGDPRHAGRRAGRERRRGRPALRLDRGARRLAGRPDGGGHRPAPRDLHGEARAPPGPCGDGRLPVAASRHDCAGASARSPGGRARRPGRPARQGRAAPGRAESGRHRSGRGEERRRGGAPLRPVASGRIDPGSQGCPSSAFPPRSPARR